MNIKAIYADHIDAWDSRADGSAYSSHASLRVRGSSLVLYTELKFVTEYASGISKPDEEKDGKTKPEGWPLVRKVEHSFVETVLKLADETEPPASLDEFLAQAHDELGLLRLDVDGESIYEYEEPTEEAVEDEDPGSEDVPSIWMPDE